MMNVNRLAQWRQKALDLVDTIVSYAANHTAPKPSASITDYVSGQRGTQTLDYAKMMSDVAAQTKSPHELTSTLTPYLNAIALQARKGPLTLRMESGEIDVMVRSYLRHDRGLSVKRVDDGVYTISGQTRSPLETIATIGYQPSAHSVAAAKTA